MISINQLRHAAVMRSLVAPVTLPKAIAKIGFVQADPIRAPARAQDLILRHRVRNYRAGDLERKYPLLEIEEDFFVNYGFLPRQLQTLLHPRNFREPLRIEREARGLSARVLAFVQENGATHPKDLEREFGRRSVGNYWGGNSSATTRVLDALHYRGQLRVARRVSGIKVYEAAAHLSSLCECPMSKGEQAHGLINLIVQIYAPLPEASLGYLVALLRYGAPHLTAQLKEALKKTKSMLPQAKIEGVNYLWPEGETFKTATPEKVFLLAPFDPIVWDRRRFEHLHDWRYLFEAYTPAAKRKLGYYALPMLWRERAVGWANLKMMDGHLQSDIGFVKGQPKEKSFQRELDAELEQIRIFLKADKDS
jgi:hypothetical protein